VTSALAILLALLLLPGCAGHAGPGDTVEYARTVAFYVTSDGTSYVHLRESQFPEMLTGAEWTLDNDLELVDADLSLSPTEVSWTESGWEGQEFVNTTYSAQGGELRINVRVRVADDAQPGWSGIRLKLPGLVSYCEAAHGRAVFPDQPGFETQREFEEGFVVAGVDIQ
jgi:hypothetical protein